jgi:phospholipase/lecithinase/hemolysin
MKLNTQLKRSAILVATLGFLFACGGSNNKLAATSAVIAFGDSLTDGGAYKNGVVPNGAGGFTTIGALGGGKFTTNGPNAKTWAELVAAGLETSASFGPAAGEGFSQGLKPNVGMYNYAQGGSKVTVTNANAATSASETSVTTQIDRHLKAKAVFGSNELVILLAGANDIFQAGGDPVKVITAAKELAAQAVRLQNAGAQRLLIGNIPDIGRAPLGAIVGPAQAAGLTQLTQLFNSELKKALDSTPSLNYLNLDVYTWNKGVLDNPSAAGISNATGMACNVAILPNNSSLFCNSATLVAPNADLTYMFADSVHPTTKAHQLFGAFALAAIKAKGW